MVVQDTGFSQYYPCGEGLISFSNLNEAEAAIDAVENDYQRHQDAALEIAFQYFASDNVLNQMINDTFSSAETTLKESI